MRSGLTRIGIPPLVGFLLLGFALCLIDHNWPLLSATTQAQLELLSQLGIFALLFRVGLESNLYDLISVIPRATFIWLINMVVSGLAGYAAARYGLGIAVVPSLIVAVAMTATSVGVGMSVWQDAGAVGSRNGTLFVDVAELDDISAIFLMIILFGIIPC